MIIFELLLQLIKNFFAYVHYGFSDKPIGFLLLIILCFALLVYSFMNIDFKRNYKKRIYIIQIIGILLNIISLFLMGLTIIAGEYLNILNISLMSNQFYIEICIIACIFEFFQWRKLKKEDYLDDVAKEEAIETVTFPIKLLLLIVMSLIFIFTNLDGILPSWGISIFGHTVGQWIYNLYLAYAVNILLEAVIGICQLLISLIFGNPMKFLETLD